MATTFRCSIVTPTATVLDQDVTYASIPAWDGQLGVMTGQSPLLTQLGVGGLRISTTAGKEQWYFIDGGFAQVHDNQLNLLTESAQPAETLSLREAEAELAEANARVPSAEEDAEQIRRDQARALAKVTVARSHGAR